MSVSILMTYVPNPTSGGKPITCLESLGFICFIYFLIVILAGISLGPVSDGAIPHLVGYFVCATVTTWLFLLFGSWMARACETLRKVWRVSIWMFFGFHVLVGRVLLQRKLDDAFPSDTTPLPTLGDMVFLMWLFCCGLTLDTIFLGATGEAATGEGNGGVSLPSTRIDGERLPRPSSESTEAWEKSPLFQPDPA